MTELIYNSEYCEKLIPIIRRAQSEIRLAIYAWRWYENQPEIGVQQLNIELLRAQARGVVIRVIADETARPAVMKTLGFDVREVERNRMLHTKAISIDELAVMLGSHNLTKRAMTDNYELSVLLFHTPTVKEFNYNFDQMWLSRGTS